MKKFISAGKNEGGYIFLEALAASIIIMVALAPIAAVYAASIKNAAHSASRTTAIFLAQERMEELKAAYNLSATFPQEETKKELPLNNVIFYRSDTSIEDAVKDYYRVTVTVEWTGQDRGHSVSLETFINKS